MMKRLVLGILAHVDAGKTTLSESMLYQTGAIRKLGRVDHGDAFLDSHALERERGITIFSKQAVLQLEDIVYTLLDTPGHVDFSPEMERTLQILDAAVLLISGTDGIQSHTETLWCLLARHHIPVFLFINKMDLAGTDRAALLDACKRRLAPGCVDFNGDQSPDIFCENLALCNESLMDIFFETGRLEDDIVADAIAQRRVFPCYFGSALRLWGVEQLLDGLRIYAPMLDASAAFGAKVYKIGRDAQGNRLTHLKITGGSLRVKTLLTGGDGVEQDWSEKVNQIRIYTGEKFQSAEEAFPGTVCAVTGLSRTRPGQGLGAEAAAQSPLLEPVLTYRVELPAGVQPHTVLSTLRQLEEEEPQLHVVYNELLGEMHVQLMGQVQLEVLKCLIRERFGLEVNFGQGSTIYKETIAAPVEGVGHFEPLRHYAEVHLLLEPGERGSGLCFQAACSEEMLAPSWQRLVLTHLEEKQHVGVLIGVPITDLKITLVAGRAHLGHTQGGDFRQATYRAVRQGLMQAESILLEPWYDFRLELPQEAVGRAMTDLQRMNGSFAPPRILGDVCMLTGSVPVASLGDYALEVAGYTRGRGRLACTLKGYAPCHNTDAVVAARGYDSNSDLENPADSVFCARGAGFTVKWDKVREHMHVESMLEQKPAAQQTSSARTASAQREAAQRREAYAATIEQDKELLAIFERTYGPVRRDPRAAFRPPSLRIHEPADTQDPNEKVFVPPRAPYTPEYLLVDGYNILFAWEDLKEIARDNLDAARSRLINMLCNYQGFRQCLLILVFDAYKVKGNPGEIEKMHNITVVYTKEAETADMYIEKVTHELGRKHRVRVATSDGLEQLIILSHGALRVSAKAFRQEVDDTQNEIRRFFAQS